jgi:hypothetical protein
MPPSESITDAINMMGSKIVIVGSEEFYLIVLGGARESKIYSSA